jgi:hypothetical protein
MEVFGSEREKHVERQKMYKIFKLCSSGLLHGVKVTLIQKDAEVIGKMECVHCIRNLQGFWPIKFMNIFHFRSCDWPRSFQIAIKWTPSFLLPIKRTAPVLNIPN